MFGAKRERALYGILHKLPKIHRYTWIRWGVGVVATLSIAALPVLDILRFDLWGGGHRWLGEPVDTVTAAKAFAFPFLAINVVIVLKSRLFGRYLCGFFCPVGTLSRLVEWARYTDRKGRWRIAGPLTAFLVSCLMAAITFAFWVDWHVFLEGSTLARTLSAVFLGSMALGLFGIVQFMGLRFCRDLCPSGVYFALLGQETINGIEFDETTCTDCGLCDVVCPVDLKPRDMSGGPWRDERGFYSDGMSNFALCLRCGDCVVACEEVGTRGEPMSALSLGALSADARNAQPPCHGASR